MLEICYCPVRFFFRSENVALKRRSPKLLCEVLKSKNVVCMPNYNVINSYLPFAFFHFSMTMLLQLDVSKLKS